MRNIILQCIICCIINNYNNNYITGKVSKSSTEVVDICANSKLCEGRANVSFLYMNRYKNKIYACMIHEYIIPDQVLDFFVVIRPNKSQLLKRYNEKAFPTK